MAEETASAAQVKRPATPTVPTPTVQRSICQVLQNSCGALADWIAKSPTGAEIYVCDEHKPLVATNYPDTQFEYEEV